MKTISVTHEGNIAILKLNRGVTNPVNHRCVLELIDAIEGIKADSNLRGLVLGSPNDKFFSIGFDIPELFPLSKEEFRQFYRDFNQVWLSLYTLPIPSVAAITGHAIAAGCILALCCDYRVIAGGRKLMGLNEVRIGVPVPYLGDRITCDVVGIRNAREIMEGGDFYSSEKLLEMGMVDRIVPLEQVLPEAMEKVKFLGSLLPAAFSMVKRNRVEVVERQYLANKDERERIFVEQWYSPDTRALLEEAMKKF
jgi:enoyl-CoA hydratase/carnithine racemase